MTDSKDNERSIESNVNDVDQAVGEPGNISSLQPINTDTAGQSPRSRGPRTPAGKRRSSQNAIRHGVFSRVILLYSESRQEYYAMLEGLREVFQPKGKLEEILVEKLAVITWRYRRLLIAESAEIQKATAFLVSDQQRKDEEEAKALEDSRILNERFGENQGLIEKFRNPGIMARCVGLLVQLRQGIEARGINRERDSAILKTIYGDTGHLFSTLPESYSRWNEAIQGSKGQRQPRGIPTLEMCEKSILDAIDKEINTFEERKQAYANMQSRRTELDRLRCMIPDSPQLDRLLRYEASLERAFDRTLSQLERLQRTQRGEPLPPRIDVNLSAS